MLNSLSSQNSLNRLVPRFSLIGVLAAVGLVSGWVPGLSQDLTLVFDTVTYAQSDEKITNYAKAVLEIEPLRKNSLEKAKRIMGGRVPTNVCRQENLPGPVQGVCKDFLDQSAEIIDQHGLSNSEFNQITRQLRKDQGLKERIQQELIRLQK